MGARILVIEDNPANLELMTYLLEAFGYFPLSATDGLDGLEAARRETLDLIICDIQLPRMDGYEIVRRLKSDPAWRPVPVIAMTALAMVGDRDRALAAGFDGYIDKPINPEAFVQQVEGFLSTPSDSELEIFATSAELSRAKVEQAQTILVVDNLAVQRNLAVCIFEPHGYRVLTAGGIAQAMEQLTSESVDLILSDVVLGGEMGFELLRMVRSSPVLRETPFVFLTSTMAEESIRMRGLDLGANDFLFRPIEPEELLTHVRQCLSRAESQPHGDHPDR